MTCHSQIFSEAPVLAAVREGLSTSTPLKWNRVHDLPGYVYFNHSIHIAKGIGCCTCHGRIDEMLLPQETQTLYLKWRLDCHRALRGYIRPRDHVFHVAWRP